MKAVRFFLSSAAAAGLAVSANAQPPINMVAPPPPVPIGIAPQPAMPGSPTIWDKLGISQQQREFCRRKCCRTPFGAAMNTIVSPLSTLSCGLIPEFCPSTPSLAELQDPGAIGAAAKVKQDRAGAEERIKAVKYLATVDCHYWPEAEDALIGALRNDRNEAVRYEAAVALASGCCCTPKVVVALSNTVGCSTSDGGFMEKSARVRQAAAVALEHCMPSCACGDLPVLELDGGKKDGGGGEKGKGEKPKDDKQSMLPTDDSPNAELKAYYKKVGKLPKSVVMNYATKAMEIGRQIGYQSTPSNATDLAAAGIPAPSEAVALAHRPTNLWDMLSGQDQPTATFAYTQMPTKVTTQPTTTVPVKTVAPSAVPKTLVSAFSPQTAEPPVRKLPPATVTQATTPAPISTPAVSSMLTSSPNPVVYSSLDPAPTPVAVKKEVLTPSVPVKSPAIAANTAVVEFKPVVEKKKMPTTEPVKVDPPATVQPAGIARVVIPAAPIPEPLPTSAVVTPAPETLVPVSAPAPVPTPSNSMMSEPVSLRQAIPARR